ncbi:branched-chain amino acid transport system permease protein [Lachnospiraceae bacterium PF1-21]|uniref:Branched-chain amino acid ABC transporter permease n=1 Tax=Ohessyouella blattaphilus TaxID=2949333 RepID=A0ABT1EF84_9FIRM|nr:branched-chain amino acid ABC transporter permease [Ohessyouella blattaphilus]MCP1109364.1 branched-chain amino acid ABC transporter permease [Ohessyouella blattaphilus]MCR8562758.1 branched-chain amino acid ABC transporter permease [Ohessyouella blattaphilus]
MKKKIFKNNMITYALIIAFYIVMQVMITTGSISSLLQGLLVPLCMYAIAAVSLNLVVGFSGELSLGHAGFMCIGAYASAIFSRVTEDSLPDLPRFLIAILIGALVAGVFGFLIGIPVLRLRGDYLAIVTLAFGEIIKNLFNVLSLGKDNEGLHVSFNDAAVMELGEGGEKIVDGALGITGTPRDSSFTIGIILLLLTVFIVVNLVNSRTGRAITAIRDNRIAAESIGLNVTKYKLMAFTISTTLAGVAGVLYAHNLSSLTVKLFNYNTSILILVFVVLGGIGNVRGSIIAAIVLTALPELLRGMANYRMLIYALLLIVMMLFNWAPAAIHFRERIKSKFSKKQEVV